MINSPPASRVRIFFVAAYKEIYTFDVSREGVSGCIPRLDLRLFVDRLDVSPTSADKTRLFLRDTGSGGVAIGCARSLSRTGL